MSDRVLHIPADQNQPVAGVEWPEGMGAQQRLASKLINGYLTAEQFPEILPGHTVVMYRPEDGGEPNLRASLLVSKALGQVLAIHGDVFFCRADGVQERGFAQDDLDHLMNMAAAH